jgi:A/G-specific adenine glycosylase
MGKQPAIGQSRPKLYKARATKKISTAAKQISLLRSLLVDWYAQNKRDFPWRRNKDPYRIWISEVMLQQTTTQAVIPYYEKFLNRFPTLKDLAHAPESEVLKYWAGLGYYSRARNLHKAAQKLNETGFPKAAAELIEYPGFGPYTSRAVSSLAFSEKVGVLDGNVIRILSRVTGKDWQWWAREDRQTLQELADQLAMDKDPSTVNQAMMELGATICTPQSPSCFICPWQKHCVGRKEGLIASLPLKKLKAETTILLWTPTIEKRGNKLAFIENTYAPFLKGAKIFPGSIRTLSQRPDLFDYKHTITKYEIYTKLKPMGARAAKTPRGEKYYWLDLDRIIEEIPYSLITKALKHLKLLT